LNSKMFGPGFRDFDYKEEYAPVYSYVTRDEDELFRRSLYRFRVRTTPQPFLTTFDCPNLANFTPTRSVTTTALQSLALLNHDFIVQQSERWADELTTECKGIEDQIESAWKWAFARTPSDQEREAAIELVQSHGLSTLCRMLLNSNEFIYVD